MSTTVKPHNALYNESEVARTAPTSSSLVLAAPSSEGITAPARQPVSLTFNEDCMLGMARYPDKFFELAIVDPPYGINAANMTMGSNPKRKGRDVRGEVQYGSVSVAQRLRKGRLNSGGGHFKNKNLTKMNCDWDFQKPDASFFAELFRVSKNQIIWGANYFELPPTRCMICWDKKQPWDNFSQFELAWTSFDYPAKLYSLSNRGGCNDEEKIHPTQKPVLLYTEVISDFAKPGAKILDTHLGSGSSRIAAYDLGFDFYGWELDADYFAAQEKRFKNFSSQPKLFTPPAQAPTQQNLF